MIIDVISAHYKGEYKIEVTFEDGATGIVDFSKYLLKGGVFERFKDIEFFKNFNINEELGGKNMKAVSITPFHAGTKVETSSYMTVIGISTPGRDMERRGYIH